MSNQFDKLLQPISQESPCGDEHCYTRKLREPLVSLRKPEVPNGDGDTSYRRNPDWDSIIELSSNALTQDTKDIRVVCHLIEAWTQVRDFDGLHEGLKLLSEFIDSCWERSNPSIDDGDLEVRSAPIENMLDDPDRGMCFPTTVRQLRLLGSAQDPCDFIRYQELRRQGEAGTQQLDRLVEATSSDWFAGLTASIEGCLHALSELKTLLSAKLGSLAPGLTYLRAAISDCQQVVLAFGHRINAPEICDSPAQDDSSHESSDNTDPNQTTTPHKNTNKFRLETRADAYSLLTEAAEFLRITEPHSPIPYLVFRAVNLGKLPFPKLVRQLVREDGILDELQREFGISQTADEADGS